MTNDRYSVISTEGSTLKVRIFYSYTVKDQAHQKLLEKHLAILRRTGSIEEWHHRKIPVGEYRKRRMKKELIKADIILLLLTPDFIASEYCYSTEVQFALQVEEKELAIVIPLLIRASRWQDTPLAKLQALPRDGESIYENATAATTSGPHFEALLDNEWKKIAGEITKIVKQLLASPDDLLEKRQMRLALEERSEAQRRTLPDEPSISQRKKKKKPLLLLSVVLIALLLMGIGGAIFALHWMSGGMHSSPSASLTTIATTKVLTPQGTFPETTGGNANTWTDYSSGGGNPGRVIPSYKTVQITCKITGLKVKDGDTWWYRVASSPWDNKYYVTADAFYNNGRVSGPFACSTCSLLVDNKVPNC